MRVLSVSPLPSPCLVLLLALALPPNSFTQFAGADDAPEITLTPQNTKVEEDGVVSFFCKATGNSTPTITWRKNGKPIGKNRHRYLMVDMPHGSVLRIEPARAHRDDSQFECVAQNGIGKPKVAAAALKVYGNTVSLPKGYPSIVQHPMLKAVEKDRNTVMNCRVSGTPEPKVTWLKDFIPVDVTDPRLKLLDTGSLQILKSQESDEGRYECVAENSVGVVYSHRANLYVRVRRVRPHFSIPPENVEVMPGGAVNITCVAIGSPMPFVKWRLGSQDLTPEDNIPIGKNVLMLTDVTQSLNYTCVATSDLGKIEASTQVRVKDLPKSPTSISVSDVTATSVQLSWSSDNSELIEKYIIQYRPKYSIYSTSSTAYSEFQEIKSRDTKYTIIGLMAYTKYEFRVIAVNNIGRSLPSKPVNIYTKELAPGSPPRDVTAHAVDSSTVMVIWQEPEIRNGLIRGHKLYYTLTPEYPISLWTVQKVGSSSMTTISGLMTNRKYTIRVLAFTNIGDGPLSEEIQVQTSLKVPDQPTNLHALATSPNTIQVRWDRPATAGDNIVSYELYYNESLSRKNLHITISRPVEHYLLDDLIPDTVYHIRVSAKSQRGEGSPTPTIQARTQEYVPEEPRKLRLVAINSTAVKVMWQPPVEKEKHGIIRGFKVHYVKVDEQGEVIGLSRKYDLVEGKKFEAIIRSLQPDSWYQFQVAAYTRKGDGHRSRPKKAKTEGAVPSAPGVLSLSLGSTNSEPVASVDWQRPRNTYGPLEVYRLVFGPKREKKEKRFFIGPVYHFTTAYLDKGTLYEFCVAAKNAVDYGEESCAEIRTPDGIPMGAPQNFTMTALSATSMRAAWDPPEKKQCNGQMILYELTYYKETNPVDTFDINTTNTYLDIKGLERNTMYLFQIKAFTSKGAWPWSTRMSFKTFEKFPEEPRILRLIAINATAVKVVWQPPVAKEKHGIIWGFQVHYVKVDEQGEVIGLSRMYDWIEGNKYEAIISKLYPDSWYQFQVTAYTRSRPKKVKTKEQECSSN